MTAFAGLHLNPRYQFNPNLSLGLQLVWSTVPASVGTGSSGGETTEQTNTLWQTGLTGRLALGDKLLDPWVALSAGAAIAQDNMTSMSSSGRELDSETLTRAAPYVGLRMGLDVHLWQHVSIGGQFALEQTWFDDQTEQFSRFEGSSYLSGPRFWYLAGLNVTVFIPMSL